MGIAFAFLAQGRAKDIPGVEGAWGTANEKAQFQNGRKQDAAIILELRFLVFLNGVLEPEDALEKLAVFLSDMFGDMKQVKFQQGREVVNI